MGLAPARRRGVHADGEGDARALGMNVAGARVAQHAREVDAVVPRVRVRVRVRARGRVRVRVRV